MLRYDIEKMLERLDKPDPEIEKEWIEEYDLLLSLGSPDEVSSIQRGPSLDDTLNCIESTCYFFERPSGAKFPVRKDKNYLIHMKKEKALYLPDLPQ